MNNAKNVAIRNKSLPLGKFYASRARMVHTSAKVAMLPDPANPEGPRIIPWTQRPGVTYNIGRNAAKRAKSDAAKDLGRGHA